MFGALDMAVDLNLEPGSSGAETVLDHCRHQLILHSRAHSLPSPIESVTPEINDLSKVETAATKAVEMGFSGMLSIHPKQFITPLRRMIKLFTGRDAFLKKPRSEEEPSSLKAKW